MQTSRPSLDRYQDIAVYPIKRNAIPKLTQFLSYPAIFRVFGVFEPKYIGANKSLTNIRHNTNILIKPIGVTPEAL